MHASWNYFAKKVSGGLAFVWLFSSLTSCLYLPFALYSLYLQNPQPGLLSLIFILGTALLHVAYSLFLQQAYRVGDFSLVYPLSRGSAPLLSTLLAIILFKERPSILALAGTCLIIASVFLLAGGTTLFSKKQVPKTHKALLFGLSTGALIAAYTLWDSYAVAVLRIPPLFYDWAAHVFISLMLTPAALKKWHLVSYHWSKHRLEVFLVASLSPLAYILVLTALSFSPVSYIAPAREISIVLGAFMGARFLQEADSKRRLVLALLMVIGVIALSLG